VDFGTILDFQLFFSDIRQAKTFPNMEILYIPGYTDNMLPD